jgi:hypothetical protein
MITPRTARLLGVAPSAAPGRALDATADGTEGANGVEVRVLASARRSDRRVVR